MSIKTQKTLRFIPIINLVTMFCWVYLQYKMQGSIPRFIKYCFIMIGSVVLVAVSRILVYELCNNDIIVNVVYYVSLYAQFYVMAFVAVKAQEKILENNK